MKAGLYLMYLHNPAYSSAGTPLSSEVLSDESLVPFSVVVDVLPSESAALADLILPDTTFLERWDLESVPSLEMVPFLSLRQPVVPPRGEAVPFQEVCLEWARRIGGGLGKFFPFDSHQAYIKAVLESIRCGCSRGRAPPHGGKVGTGTARPGCLSYEEGGF